jgi:hypothetical protein
MKIGAIDEERNPLAELSFVARSFNSELISLAAPAPTHW